MTDLGPVSDALGTDIGPLPAWQWGLIGAGAATVGVLAWRRLRPRRPIEEVTDTAELETVDPYDPNPTTPLFAAGGGFMVPIGAGGPVNATGATVTPAATPEPVIPRSNDDWARDAQNDLIARGYNGAAVTNAIGRYLYGMDLYASERAIVDAAIRYVGAPPVPIAPPKKRPTPTPPVSKPKPRPTPKPKPVPKVPKPTPPGRPNPKDPAGGRGTRSPLVSKTRGRVMRDAANDR